MLLAERLRDFHFLVILAHSIVVVHYKVFLKVRRSRHSLLTRGAAAKRLKERFPSCTAPRYFIEHASRPPLDYFIWHHIKDCIFDKGQSTRFILGTCHISPFPVLYNTPHQIPELWPPHVCKHIITGHFRNHLLYTLVIYSFSCDKVIIDYIS